MAETVTVNNLVTANDKGRLNYTDPSFYKARLGTKLRNIVFGMVEELDALSIAVDIPNLKAGDVVVLNLSNADTEVATWVCTDNTLTVTISGAPTGHNFSFIAFPTGT